MHNDEQGIPLALTRNATPWSVGTSLAYDLVLDVTTAVPSFWVLDCDGTRMARRIPGERYETPR